MDLGIRDLTGGAASASVGQLVVAAGWFPPWPWACLRRRDLILIMHVLSCYPLQLIAQSSLQLPASRGRRGREGSRGSEMDGWMEKEEDDGKGEGSHHQQRREGGRERRRSNLAGRACNQSMGCRCWAGCWSVWAHTYFHSSLGDSFFPSHAILSSSSSRTGNKKIPSDLLPGNAAAHTVNR
jgi:hypothetical protein